MRRLAVAVLVVTAVLTGTAYAQAPAHVRIAFNMGPRTAAEPLTHTFSLPLFLEDATVSNEVSGSSSPFIDIGGHYRLGGRIWAGLAFTSSSWSSSGDIAAEVPSPFYFNEFTTATTMVRDLKGSERGTHLSLGYLQPLGQRLNLMIFGGPSRLAVTHDLITDLAFDGAYPFQAPVITSATRQEVSGSGWGFNLGADLAYRLSPALSVGGLIRMSRSSVTLFAAPGNEVTLNAGGVQAGGGVRLSF